MKNETEKEATEERGTSALTRLLCCPFCGAGEEDEYRPSPKDVASINMAKEFAVHCDNCNSMGDTVRTKWKGHPDTIEDAERRAKEEAIKLWNRRAV